MLLVMQSRGFLQLEVSHSETLWTKIASSLNIPETTETMLFLKVPNTGLEPPAWTRQNCAKLEARSH